jgi:putative hemolysin
LDGDMPLREAVDFILKQGLNSRYPIYRKDVDDIIGILHMKDALISVEHKKNASRKLGEIEGLLREAVFIPETRNINELFKEMQSEKIHMVIVVDEYGQTAGVVTMEDILEEIVGNILDEYDVDEEYIVPSDDGSYIMNGMTLLEDVEKVLDIEFEEEDYDSYDTINGLLISKLDRIPQEGEQTEVSVLGYRFKIIQVKNKMIQSILVRKQEADEPMGEEEAVKKLESEPEHSEALS